MSTVKRKRRLLLGGAIAAFLLMALCVGLNFKTREPQDLLLRLHQVKEGMTLPKIVEIVGCSPGAFGDGIPNPQSGSFSNFFPTEWWIFTEWQLVVYFDKDGKAVEVRIDRVSQLTFTERIYRFLGT